MAGAPSCGAQLGPRAAPTRTPPWARSPSCGIQVRRRNGGGRRRARGIRGRRCLCRVFAGPPSWNPQNTPDPLTMPSPELSPEESVGAQLDALQKNDEPWSNHGVQTLYEFAEDAGGMERSGYFGFSKDLYHFDHFLGGFLNAYPELVNLSSYSMSAVEDGADGTQKVTVRVKCANGQEVGDSFAFTLTKRKLGRKKGSWMTKSLLRETLS